ncbi:hypothetical protein FRC04_001277 [Tulasnella sp. 424]|nr:hypothetical protein FRC04_001277 [Tulasnella sp. 424]KAG8970474.1 hypothetical protein FRC05_000581 [Tulasnella sp. 425]
MFASALILTLGLSLASAVKAATAAPWAQCGGITYKGPIECDPGYVCTYMNPYYSQCIPSTTTTKSTTTDAGTTTDCIALGWCPSSSTTSSRTTTTTTSTSKSTTTTTTTTQTTTRSSSSSTKTATQTCPYAIPRATGTPIGAITEGTAVYGFYLQRDSTTNEAILIPDPYAPEIYYSSSIYRMEYVGTTGNCVSRVYLNIYQPTPSTISYKQLKWSPNVGLTFSWKSDTSQVLQTITTNNGFTTNWGDHDWFLACLQDGKWKVYLQTGADVPADVTCVSTQLKLGYVVAE